MNPFIRIFTVPFMGETHLKDIDFEYVCVQVNHHKRIAKVIAEYQKEGWRLHTYQATGDPNWVNHYLLFQREMTW